MTVSVSWKYNHKIFKYSYFLLYILYTLHYMVIWLFLIVTLYNVVLKDKVQIPCLFK